MTILSAEAVAAEMPPAFHAYGPSHWALLALTGVLAAVLTVAARRLRARGRDRRLGRPFAAVVAAVLGGGQVYWMLPPRFELGHSLPFQLCDLAWMACAWAHWTEDRRAYALVYFWGLTLTPQALLTPHLDFDFPNPQFLMFSVLHAPVVAGAVCAVWGRGYRPAWKDFRFAVAVTGAWALFVLAFNLLAGANYMYLKEKPPTASILDLMGPWPLYLLVESAAVLGIWALITWPWERTRSSSPRG